MTAKEYQGRDIQISYDPARCRHVAACIKGAPEVFDTGRRPWILPDGHPDADHVAEVIRRCPTGALHYQLASGIAEVPDEVTTLTPLPDGPVLARGCLRIRVGGEVVEESRAALCRCGHSTNKPFCDGTHEQVGWRSSLSED